MDLTAIAISFHQSKRNSNYIVSFSHTLYLVERQVYWATVIKWNSEFYTLYTTKRKDRIHFS